MILEKVVILENCTSALKRVKQGYVETRQAQTYSPLLALMACGRFQHKTINAFVLKNFPGIESCKFFNDLIAQTTSKFPQIKIDTAS